MAPHSPRVTVCFARAAGDSPASMAPARTPSSGAAAQHSMPHAAAAALLAYCARFCRKFAAVPRRMSTLVACTLCAQREDVWRLAAAAKEHLHFIGRHRGRWCWSTTLLRFRQVYDRAWAGAAPSCIGAMLEAVRVRCACCETGRAVCLALSRVHPRCAAMGGECQVHLAA